MKQSHFLGTYSKFLQNFLKPQRPLKMVFDCSNGAAGLVLKQLKASARGGSALGGNNLKLKTYFINEKPNGNFPAHGPDPLKPGATKQLQAAVKKNKADLGIIFDADADRVFFVDNKSRFVNPDAIARLLIWQLKPKKMIIDVTTGWLVKKLQASSFKLQVIESKVGHYFIKKLMRKENADFGAEHSGHYYFKKFFYLDSGILAAIEVINAVPKLPYKISDFVDLLPQYYRLGIDFPLKRFGHQKTGLLKKIETCYKLKTKNSKLKAKISYLDGLTMEFPGWWFNLRFSQTEPLLRLNAEAESQSKLKSETSNLKSLIYLTFRF